MRFVVTGEWTRNHLLKVIVWCFLVYALVLWVTNAGLYFAKMSLTPSSVMEYYCGNEAKFLQPRSLQGLLETLHFHAFGMGIMLLTLTHLVLFVPIAPRTKVLGIAVAFSSGLLGELSSWGVRFVHPLFAYIKIACFLALEGAILWLVIAVAYALVAGAPSAYEQSNAKTPPLL